MASAPDPRRSSLSQVASFDIEAPPVPFTQKGPDVPSGMTLVRVWQWLTIKVVLVLLFMAVVVLAVAFGVTRSSNSTGTSNVAQPLPLNATTSVAVNACHDFQEFVCPSLIAQYPGITAPLFSELATGSDAVYRALLSSADSAPNLAVFNNFYQSCVNDNATIVEHLAILHPWFDAIDSNVTNLESYMTALGQIRSGTGVSVLLEMNVLQAAGEPGVLLIAQGGLSMSAALYEWTYEIEQLQTIATASFILLGADASSAVDSAISVMEFEYDLSLITESGVLGLGDFDEVSLDVILGDERLQLAALLVGAGINVTGGASSQPYAVGIAAPSFFGLLPGLLANTPLSTLQAHAKWRTFWGLLNALNGNRLAAGYSILNPQTPQAAGCLQTTIQWVGDVLDSGYVAALMPVDTKRLVVDMLSQLSLQWIQLFSEQTWMDDATRQSNLYKLGNMSFELGGATMQHGYDTINVSATNSFLQNMLAVASLTSHNQWAMLQSVTVKAPSFPASSFIAQYGNKYNTIQLAAYMVQPPIFDTTQPSVLNWARLGSILGHEIGHAFDSPSKNNNTPYGSWSNASTSAYARLSQCLVQQYDNTSYTLNLTRWGDDFNDFPIIDAHIKGQQTLGENVADYGGVHAAYNAYRAAMGASATAGTDQQFFTGYAQMWCADMDDYTLWNLLKTDTHAIAQARINNVLSMFKPFAAAYDCPVGSPMNPVQQCNMYN